MEMTVKLHAGHDVDVTLPRVGNDAANLLLRKSGIVVEDRVAFYLDTRFGVEIILIGLPLSQKIDLFLDLIFGGQRSVAHVDQDAAVRKGRPIADFDFRKRRFGARSFGQLPQSLNTTKQTRR